MDKKIAFIPVVGTEEEIFNTRPQEGYVYFALDTKKIYYGSQEASFIPMGGNSGIYYGTKEIEEDSNIVEFSDLQDLEREEDNLLGLNIKDLILNIPNGSFYRVLSFEKIDDDIIYITEKMTISGSGGGGSGEISINGTAKVKIDKTINKNVMINTNPSFYLPFTISAKYADGTNIENTETTATVTIMRLGISNTTKGFVGKEKINQLTFYNVPLGSCSYDIGSICKNISTREAQYFRVKVSVFTGGETESVSFDSIQLFLIPATGNWLELIDNDNKTIIHSTDEDLLIRYQLGGTGLYNFIKFYINNECIYTSLKFQNDGTYINFEENINKSLFSMYNFNHGIYPIKLEIYASTSDSLVFNKNNDICIFNIEGTGVFYDENNGDYIINTSLTNLQFMQYDLISIPIILYGKDNMEGVTLVFTDNVNGLENKVTIENVHNNEWQYFSYTPTTTGEITLNFAILGQNSFNLVCDIIPLNLGELGTAVTDKLMFNFQAKNFSNTEALKNWQFNIDGEIKSLIFSQDFNFNDGGIKTDKLSDGSLQSYCLIKAGDTIEFPYKLFAPRLGDSVNNTGRHFKIIFKATFCENYHAAFGGFGNINNTNYIIFDAQQCSYKIGGTTGTVKYIEDQIIELEIEIDGNNNNNNHPYISTWVNGTPYSITQRPDNVNLTWESPLILGSTQCDLQVYLIKEYNKSLSDIEHLRNFIADSLTSEEMKKRYNRNNILEEGSLDLRNISIKKLIEANPECIVHTYEIDHLPTTKIKKEGATDKCIYKQYRKDFSDLSTPYVWHNDCKLGVQGTSSLNYIISGANLDTNFGYKESTDKLFHYGRRDENNNYVIVDDENNEITTINYQLTKDSIPCNYFNTKVNVASAENTNNALLQEEYQLYNPYKSPVTKLNDTTPPPIGKYRDTIEFTNGLLFLIDKNLKFPADGENSENGKNKNVFCEYEEYKNKLQTGQPLTPQFYAICNFGNSKNNTEVFHRTDEMCVEVKDNPYAYTMMKEKLPQGSTETSVEKYFEFRYKPDLNNEFKQEHNLDLEKEAFDYWVDFLNWMVDNNPVNATNENLSEEVTFSSFKFSDKSPWLKEILGNNFSINAFVGPHNQDTKEYRMGKMLNECEDHLAMDSLVYHYLFTERHTMIDNIVKNTFWSSSVDSQYQIWDLSKDYDNDTADGNDNNGRLTIDYGFEGLDNRLSGMSDLAENVEDAISTSTLFNGAQFCSWYNFIHNLMPYLKTNDNITPYSNLASENKWGINGEKYLNKCKQWQDMIPEVCWILDAYRKYKRPYEIYNDSSYLDRLEGGKKTYQRAAFEMYQCNYLNSKYLNNAGQGIYPRVVFNFNDPIVIPVKFYQKGYLRCKFAEEYQTPQRINDINKFYYIKVPTDTIGGSGEIGFNLYYPELFSEIGQESDYGLIQSNNNFIQATENDPSIKYSSSLANLNATHWDFSAASKLTKLILGNNYDILKGNQSEKTSYISFAPTSLLKYLSIKNFQPNPEVSNGNVDNITISLNNLSRLKYLDLTNTKCNAVVVADNAPLETFILNNPESLTLTNLYKLSNVIYSDNENQISNLVSLHLNNIDNKKLLSYSLLEKAISLKSYELQNIYWDLNNQYFREVNETINDEHIYILDELLNEHENIYEYINKNGEPILPTELLSGIIRISSDLYSGTNSLNLYNKYILGIAENWNNTKYFKNLKLEFLNPNSKLYNFYIYNGDNSILWERQFSQLSDINESFFNKGKKLNGLGNYSYNDIKKNETLEKVFTKNNYWTIKLNGVTILEHQEINNLATFDFNQFNTDTLGNIECIPEFNESDRLFTINIITQDQQGNNLHTEELQLKYNSSLNDIIDAIRWIPYRINENEEIHTVQKWTGLSRINNGTPLFSYNIISDTTFYPTFEEIIDITQSSWEFDKKYFKFTEYLGDLKWIAPNPDYTLNGKIVLPSTDLNNNKVVGIKPFAEQKNITHILFNNLFDSDIITIADKAFQLLTSLEYFDFNYFDKIILGEYSFDRVHNLKNTEFTCIINNIGQQCFKEAFKDNIVSLKIKDIQQLNPYAFYNNPNLNDTLSFTAFDLNNWIDKVSSYRTQRYRIFSNASNQAARFQNLEITFNSINTSFPNDYPQSIFESDLKDVFGLSSSINIIFKEQ